MLAPSTLNMLPKLLLAPMPMYLRMLAKTLRPSSMPSSSTSRLFSSRIRSADSFAMATAVSTLTPHVRRPQGRCRVDPVPHETDRVPARLKRVADPLLVRGTDAGEQRRARGRLVDLLLRTVPER